jgi:hypothetical protein
MKIKLYLIIIIVCIVLFGLLYIRRNEGFINYSEYNKIDRIKTLDGEYGYCIAGNVQCISGNLIEEKDNYHGGKTYKSECDNFGPVECQNNFQYKYGIDDLDWETPTAREISFPFSDQYKGFTVPYSYIPVEISGNYIQFYDSNGNVIDSMNKCDMLETKKLTDECYDALKPKSESKGEPSPCKPKKCIANHGTKVGDSLCCGQKGVLQKYATKYVCSKSAPTCSNFVCGESYGTCS